VATFVDKLAAEKGINSRAFEQEFFEHARPTSLLKRFIEPEEVAALVAFVASPKAAAINGAALRADGGVARSIA